MAGATQVRPERLRTAGTIAAFRKPAAGHIAGFERHIADARGSMCTIGRGMLLLGDEATLFGIANPAGLRRGGVGAS